MKLEFNGYYRIMDIRSLIEGGYLLLIKKEGGKRTDLIFVDNMWDYKVGDLGKKYVLETPSGKVIKRFIKVPNEEVIKKNPNNEIRQAISKLPKALMPYIIAIILWVVYLGWF